MKAYFLHKLADLLPLDANSRVVDMGSGKSLNFLPLLQKIPTLNYTGLEPDAKSVAEAKRVLANFPNAKVFHQLGYSLPPETAGKADLVISLSVLEHIKNLEPFIKSSVAAARPGGHIIHRYDLGHALYPSSFKEKLQTFLCQYLPWLIPEHKYAAYVPVKMVEDLLIKYGAEVEKVTYHQMPGHKKFLKYFKVDTLERQQLAEELIEWEFKVSPYLESIPREEREKLFPAICVWAKKKA